LGRLSLVIADYDAEYIQNFEKYLVTYHPKRFELASFSAAEPLNAYLGEPHKIDVLLVNSKMYKEIVNRGRQEIVLILSENEPITQPGQESVNKYQHMDRLISEVIRLYTLGSRKECPVSGSEGTRVISVVSPAGGTGKSSIAAGCSILCAGRGMRAFYMDLEDIPSTEMFFHGDSRQSFSNVIYQLKGNSPNLWLKLEAARCIDAGTGVHFFRPAANILDMNELTEQDLARLLHEFRKSSAYSVVFVDLPTGLNERNSSVLKYSDAILLILTPDFKLQNSIEKFSKGLEMFEERLNINLMSKLLPIMNFSKKQNRSGEFFGYKPIVEISDHSVPSGTKAFIKPVENPAFLAELNKVVNHILPDKKSEAVPEGWTAALWDGAAFSGGAASWDGAAASWDGASAPVGGAATSLDIAVAPLGAIASGSGATAHTGGVAALGDTSDLWDGGEFIV
jgi:cellulose biosynthesis protein BcsQ